MYYSSTRGTEEKVTASQAIIKGISNDGGLYVPSKFPNVKNELINLVNLTYSQIAFFVLSKFLCDFTEDEIKNCIENAYDEKFDCTSIAPLNKVNDTYFLELYHGPTLAFKDMALTIMPHLLKTSIKKDNLEKDVVILTATSGDTGKAALEGFKDIDKIKIIVFFPEDGVSPVQKLQMKTQTGKNTYVIGIKGNFDDAQSGVKKIFSDKEFNQKLLDNNYILSSANSINIGRLLPQVAYYFYSYMKLVDNGEIQLNDKINFVVPTGNFGNILAGYYAKQMGLPINKLICASNDNNVLYDFFKTGVYDKNRALKLTTSPSMDILISSNLERLLFEISNKNTDIVNKLLLDLNDKGVYKINEDMEKNLVSFYGEYSNEEEVKNTINNVFKNYNYLIDTHTAVAYNCYEKYKKETSDNTKTVIVSTASPFKFSENVLKSIDCDFKNLDDFAIIDRLSSISKIDIPKPIKNLKDAEILHKDICEKDELKLAIKKFLKV
ncbi:MULTISPECIES: threonine synthase [unclassified Clostridioides]|uniref:threonine synthase n=1 Tax=unclassified Clostridioides TaxID=2635829 RepID=UPI001D0F5B88|nr:threonine synthase [Clostridioides sp. ES-S-0171-01]MCC0687779.1 threonine synthase [Clostridioides sp. ES-S-0056-01]MCC0714738.1 threonine synthase [Clostridioides sp. ES-S-0077-01]UDN53269.1 threonine synthase [Clostridioides sp. ES-S-0054-01]